VGPTGGPPEIVHGRYISVCSPTKGNGVGSVFRFPDNFCGMGDVAATGWQFGIIDTYGDDFFDGVVKALLVLAKITWGIHLRVTSEDDFEDWAQGFRMIHGMGDPWTMYATEAYQSIREDLAVDDDENQGALWGSPMRFALAVRPRGIFDVTEYPVITNKPFPPGNGVQPLNDSQIDHATVSRKRRRVEIE
jgi:hypothetical protein